MFWRFSFFSAPNSRRQHRTEIIYSLILYSWTEKVTMHRKKIPTHPMIIIIPEIEKILKLSRILIVLIGHHLKIILLAQS